MLFKLKIMLFKINSKIENALIFLQLINFQLIFTFIIFLFLF